jgi:tRNA U34 5-carboxymethylaminomethyl modifying GTPase MnmE/TrmE
MDPNAWKDDMGLLPDGRCIPTSCKTGQGLAGIAEVLESAIGGALAGEDVALLSARHCKEAEDAVLHLVKLGEAMQAGSPLELWAEELKAAALAVGRIRGRDLPADAFEEIFNTFCIGK